MNNPKTIISRSCLEILKVASQQLAASNEIRGPAFSLVLSHKAAPFSLVCSGKETLARIESFLKKIHAITRASIVLRLQIIFFKGLLFPSYLGDEIGHLYQLSSCNEQMLFELCF